MVIEGAVDQLVFDQYVEFLLVPQLLPQDCVMLDNLSFHSSSRAYSLIEAASAADEVPRAFRRDE